jgi:hypothetical protein
VPAKPAWYPHLDSIIQAFLALPRPFVDRAAIEDILGVGRRRAQQIMAPCITDHIGANGLVDRDLLIRHLRALARSEAVSYECVRRRKVAGVIDSLRRDRLERPQVLVEAPTRVVNQQLSSLPPGVQVQPGRITVQFDAPQEALEKLLALAMAIGNDYNSFEELATR